MKFTVLGGGGIRSPFLAKSIACCAREIGITEIVFMDISRDKLDIYGELSREVCRAIDSTIHFETTTDPVLAVRDADYVITTLRVGGDEARVKDERIALGERVLGQETTGAGGFAMAMRSIPALLSYMELIKQYARPDCLVFNFTNPSGLVTQALIKKGYDNVIGICDNPVKQREEYAQVLGISEHQLDARCYGLNHLSWFSSLKVDGREMITDLIHNPKLYSDTETHFFAPEFVKWNGLLPNGYLYYYYYREEAVAHILNSGKTRGETILEINKKMNDVLSGIDMHRDFEKAGLTYLSFMLERENSYMAIESGEKIRHRMYNMDKLTKPSDAEGYAGVALNIIRALRGGSGEHTMELITKNRGAIAFLDHEDTVEITCRVDKDGIRPLPVDEVPVHQKTLIMQMKAYENLSVDSILKADTQLAIAALMTNPLVNSYPLAKRLLQSYLNAHAEHLPVWRQNVC